jgi:pimeloyl-ACP methyl ester carboxylesterase
VKATLRGTELHYDARGTGPALLFLHAFPLGQFMWDGQAEAFSGDHRVIRFDARGFGGTPADETPLTMDQIADDGAALMGLLGTEKAVVVGCSMGGYAAFAFARRHPERLVGLVLQDTRAGADTEEARAYRATLAAKILEDGPQAAVDAFLPKLVGETTRRDNPALVARIGERILATSATGIAQALHGLGARPDSSGTLEHIRVPTLVIVGEEDVLTPPAEAEKMARGIAGSRVEVVPRAGHLSNLENPGAFDAVLRGFLDGLRAG